MLKIVRKELIFMERKEIERMADLFLHYTLLMSILHAKLKILDEEFIIREKIRKLEAML